MAIPGFIHNGALAGLVAVCAGSDVMHPIGALFVGGVAGVIFVYVFQVASNAKWKFDDVLGVWPLHGLCGLWGGIACGIFGLTTFGGMGGVSFYSQLVGSLMGAAYGALAGFIIYGVVDTCWGCGSAPRTSAAAPTCPSTRSAPTRKKTCAWGGCERREWPLVIPEFAPANVRDPGDADYRLGPGSPRHAGSMTSA